MFMHRSEKARSGFGQKFSLGWVLSVLFALFVSFEAPAGDKATPQAASHPTSKSNDREQGKGLEGKKDGGKDLGRKNDDGRDKVRDKEKDHSRDEDRCKPRPNHPFPIPKKMPGRVRVFKKGDTATVRGECQEMLRGSPMAIFMDRRSRLKESTSEPRYPLNDYILNPDYYRLLKTLGINAIRLVAFDPWQRSHGDPGSLQSYPAADFTNPLHMAELVLDIDAVVTLAAEQGMYVMINYHDTGGYRDPNYSLPAGTDRHFSYGATTKQIEAFWNVIAPRYANCTHVFYELMNEPVKWHPNDYTEGDLVYFAQLYRLVRFYAPNTHIVLGSLATPQSFSPNRTILDLANQLQGFGVSFRNASIGFHPYQLATIAPDGELDDQGFPVLDMLQPILRAMKAGIPLINTEQNFPEGRIDSDDPDAPGLFPEDVTGVQSMERLGISWFHWNTAGPEEVDNLLHVVVDSILYGYDWFPRKSKSKRR